ncbi:hypothetical protein [Geoglobus acetivorans]|uniref:hypothetical protein n=1 Tax=Geoglobus acetivorans TaxID=565033 RepID=UPI00296F19F0
MYPFEKILVKVGIPKMKPPRIKVIIIVKLFDKIKNIFILFIGKKEYSDNFGNLLH